MGTAAVEAVLAVTTTARSLLVVSAVAVAVVTISVTATLATMGMSITMTSCLLPIGSSARSQYTALSVTNNQVSQQQLFLPQVPKAQLQDGGGEGEQDDGEDQVEKDQLLSLSWRKQQKCS